MEDKVEVTRGDIQDGVLLKDEGTYESKIYAIDGNRMLVYDPDIEKGEGFEWVNFREWYYATYEGKDITVPRIRKIVKKEKRLDGWNNDGTYRKYMGID